MLEAAGLLLEGLRNNLCRFRCPVYCVQPDLPLLSLTYLLGMKKLAITTAEPLESKKIKDTINKVLHTIKLNPGCLRIFKASRPLAENMSGGPVRVMIQFSINSPAELFQMLDSLVRNTVFELVNANLQHHSLVRSPLDHSGWQISCSFQELLSSSVHQLISPSVH